MTTQLDAFGAPSEAPARPRTAMDAGHHALTQTRGMARTGDPDTSHAAAATIVSHLTDLQRVTYDAYRRHGREMTPLECEALPEFVGMAATTIRHRVGDLAKAPHFLLVVTGERRGGSRVHRMATPEETRRMRREAGCP